MTEKLGRDPDEVVAQLSHEGIPRTLNKEAMNIAGQRGAFTVFALVDALTQLTQQVQLAGDHLELDAKIGQLLSLAIVMLAFSFSILG